MTIHLTGEETKLLEFSKWWRQHLNTDLSASKAYAINQRLANYSQTWPCCLFLQILCRTHLPSFIYILFTDVFMLRQQSCKPVTDPLWPAKSKLFTIWPFAESLLTSPLMKHFSIYMYFLPTFK